MIAAAPLIRHEVVLGRSERGRPIVAWETGDPQARRRVLVVGCIHGNEPAGIAVADAVVSARVPAGTDVWVVPDLNPDGVALDTRQNARGVDLNRNFPYRWRPLSGVFYSGRRALSESESRIAYRLIRRIPLARFGTVAEIADTVLFLASPGSAYTTGTIVVVDGGQWLASAGLGTLFGG